MICFSCLAILNFELPFVAATQYILATDYKNYTVVQQCNNYLLFNIQFVWAFSRTPVASAQTNLAITAAFVANGVSVKDIIEIDQNACPANRV
jgi:Lipocalin / cytosolic fatty-acid binding protein family